MPSKALPFPLIFKELKAFTLGKRKKEGKKENQQEKRSQARIKAAGTGSYRGFVQAPEQRVLIWNSAF